jgi:hypothetical protein
MTWCCWGVWQRRLTKFITRDCFVFLHARTTVSRPTSIVIEPIILYLFAVAINNGKNAMVVDATARDVIIPSRNPNPSNTKSRRHHNPM